MLPHAVSVRADIPHVLSPANLPALFRHLSEMLFKPLPYLLMKYFDLSERFR